MLRLLFIACFILSATHVHAKPTSDEGAARLKKVFEDLITEQKNMVPASAPLRPVFQGEVNVEKTDTYYAVTLPYFRFMFQDGARFDFGMISINASHDETHDDRWKMALAMPTPLTFFDKDDKELFKIGIGAQRTAGIWDESISNFMKLDALYSDIIVSGAGESAPFFKIPQSLIRYDMTEDKKNRMSGKGFMVVKNMNLQVPEAQLAGSIAMLRSDFELDRYDVNGFKHNQKRLMALVEAAQTQGLDEKAHAKELYSALMETYKSLGEKANVDYTISGLNIETKDPKNPSHLELDEGRFGLDIGGFISDRVFLGLNFGFDGLNLKSEKMEESQDIIPSNVNFDMAIKNIPLEEVSGIANNTIQSVSQNPKMSNIALMSLMMKLPALLSQAGTTLEINKNYFGAKDYRFDIDGNVTADIKAVNTATADIKAKFKGLDKFIAMMQTNMPTDDAKQQRRQNSLKTFEQMKTLGRLDGDTYHYHLQMTETGELLLNGQDASTLLGGSMLLPQ